jgi:hypothetical protein
MLKRTDWRALQWTEGDASEPILLEFRFEAAFIAEIRPS